MNWNLLLVALSLCLLLGSGNAAFATAPDESAQNMSETRERCLEVLREGMLGNEFWPSIHAAEALTLAGHTQEVREFLEPRLNEESDAQKRCGLAREMVRAGNKTQVSVLIDILRDAAPHGHVHAAESLYKVGWQGDVPDLQQALLEDRDIRLRIMAAAALAKHGQGLVRAQSLAFLRTTLRQERDPEIFRLSAWVLGRVGDDGDRPRIRSRLVDTQRDALSRAFLEHALAALGDPQGEQALLSNLESANATVRTYAALFAGELRLSQATPSLLRQLDDQNLDARIRAAQSLILLNQSSK